MGARRAVLRAGAVEAAVGAMRGLARAIAVQEEGVRFLGTLATMGSAKNQEHACVAIGRCANLSLSLCASMSISRSRSRSHDARCIFTITGWRLRRAGGISAILASLLAHPEDLGMTNLTMKNAVRLELAVRWLASAGWRSPVAQLPALPGCA